MAYKFNVFTGTFDEVSTSGSSGAQTYDEFIYNSSGAQSGNRYNTWSNLMTAIATGQEGPTKITFEQNETLPAGTWDLDFVTLAGDGRIAVLGGLVVTIPTGFVLGGSGYWKNGQLTAGLGISYTGTSTFITLPTGVTTFTLDFGNVIETTAASFFDIPSGAISIIALRFGSSMINSGYEPVTIASGALNYITVGSSNAQLGNDVFRGTSDPGGGVLLIDSPASFVLPTRTDANLTGTYSIALASRAYNVRFDNGGTGLAADNVQDALEELDGDSQKRMELIGTYSYGSDNINFYDGRPNIALASYTAKSGEVLRIRTAGSKDFGAGTVYGEVNDFIYYDRVIWKPWFNPARVAGFTSNSLLASGNSGQIQTLNTATYPDLTELSYLKGVTSAIQTQIDNKMGYISTGTARFDGGTNRDYRILGDAFINTLSTITPSTNRWFFEPYLVTEEISLNRVAVEVTTAGAAGKLMRLSLYTADDYWQPNTLVQDFGTVPTDVGAVPALQAITINLTIPPGRYVGVWIQDGGASFRTVNCLTFPGNALNNTASASAIRASYQSVNGSGTVASGFAAVNPKWERDLYTTSGNYGMVMRFREA